MFKRAIGYYTYQRRVVSESVKVPATQAASEKVANVVGTFLNEDSEGFQLIKVTTKEVVQDIRALKNRKPELSRCFIILDGYPDGVPYHSPSFYNS